MIDRKPIFDAVRGMLKRGFSTSEIKALDNAIDLALGVIVVTPPKQGLLTEEENSAVINHLRIEEGVRPKAYRDHLGYWTIGVGRLIDKAKGGRITPEEDAILLANDPSRKGRPWTEYELTDPEINMLLANDVEGVVQQLSLWKEWEVIGDNIPRKVALISMAFQMGIAGLFGFKNSLKMLREGRFADAAANMMLSKWAKQTPARAERVTDMIKTGEFA